MYYDVFMSITAIGVGAMLILIGLLSVHGMYAAGKHPEFV